DDRDALTGEIADGVQIRVRGCQQAAAVDECHQAEIHALLARESGGRRAAFDVHFAAGHHVDSVIDGHRNPLNFECLDTQLFFDAARDTEAQFDRVADGPLV